MGIGPLDSVGDVVEDVADAALTVAGGLLGVAIVGRGLEMVAGSVTGGSDGGDGEEE
jgi:hypothetical protein